MNTKKYISLILLLICTVGTSFALDKEKFEHRFIIGYNLGATFPGYVPREVRSIDGWWPQFTPQLGYNIIYNTKSQWSFGAGIMFDYKGMGTKESVKDMFTQVRLEDGGELLDGYFTGMNETRVKIAYVTAPVFVRYKLNEKWHVRVGGYASYAFSASFKGDVWDGTLRTPQPTGEEVDARDKGDTTFDFGSDVRDFDFGILAGGEMKLNQKFNLFGNVSWGLTPIFHSSFKAMPFKMHNLYISVGFAYKLQ